MKLSHILIIAGFSMLVSNVYAFRVYNDSTDFQNSPAHVQEVTGGEVGRMFDQKIKYGDWKACPASDKTCNSGGNANDTIQFWVRMPFSPGYCTMSGPADGYFHFTGATEGNLTCQFTVN